MRKCWKSLDSLQDSHKGPARIGRDCCRQRRPHAIAPTMLEDRILFIDGEAIVIDKPAGLPVDPPRRGGDSLDGADRRIEMLASSARRRSMHRLDQDTSGCLLLARNPKARAGVPAGVRSRARSRNIISRWSAPRSRRRGRDRPAARQGLERRGRLADGRRPGRPVGAHAAGASSSVRDGQTLVEFRPLTGRTHQIRVHAREGFGSGIVGDRVYGIPGGADAAPRLAPGRSARRASRRSTSPRRCPRRFGDWRDDGLRTSSSPRTR